VTAAKVLALVNCAASAWPQRSILIQIQQQQH